MKKQLIALVATIVVLLVSVGGYMAVDAIYGLSDPLTETADPSIKGYDSAEIQRTIKSMTVTNLYGTLNFTPKPDEDPIYSNRWYIAEFGNQLSHNTSVHAIAENFFVEIPALGYIDVEDVAELKTYGLDDPSVVVTINMLDGESFKFSYGIRLGFGENTGGYYLRRDNEMRVYIVEDYYYSIASVGLADLLNHNIIDGADSSTVITRIKIYGSDFKETTTMTLPDVSRSIFYLEPQQLYTTYDTTEPLVNMLALLESNYRAYASVDGIPDDILSFYGFDGPPKKCIEYDSYWEETVKNDDGEEEIIKHDMGTVRMFAGSSVYDESYGANIIYVMVEGRPIIYGISQSLISAWYDFDVDAVASHNLLNVDILSVDKLVIDTDFKKFTFDVSTTLNIDKVSLNGKDFDVAEYKEFYTSLMMIAYSERTGDSPSGGRYMTITFEGVTGTNTVVKFTQYNSRRYYMEIDGRGGLLVSYQVVDNILEQLKQYDKGSF